MKEVLQEKEELKQRIHELEKEAEDGKKKREWIVTAAFSAIFFLVFYFELKPEGIGDILGYVISAVVWASIHMAVHSIIFGWIDEKRQRNQIWIDILKKELSEYDKK